MVRERHDRFQVWFCSMLLGAFVPHRDETIQPFIVDEASAEPTNATTEKPTSATATTTSTATEKPTIAATTMRNLKTQAD